jgi:hypothetical protein
MEPRQLVSSIGPKFQHSPTGEFAMHTEVILTKSVSGLGAEGDKITVAPGYARNYLIPRGIR